MAGRRGELRGCRVLVVEDDLDLRDLTTFTLESEGARVTTAPDAYHALVLLRVQQFDLLLMDLMLPGANGVDLLERLAEDHGRHIPAVVLTGMGPGALADRAVELGAVAVVEKPFTPSRLVETAAAALMPSLS